MGTIGTTELKGHLQLIEKATKEFLKSAEDKSQEQFEAEIEAIKHLLDYTKKLFPVEAERNFIEIPPRFSSL